MTFILWFFGTNCNWWLGNIRESLSTTDLSKQVIENQVTNKVLSKITNWSGDGFVASVKKKKNDPFQCNLKCILNYLSPFLHQNYKHNTMN